MFTPEQIEEILKPWGESLKDLPTPQEDVYTYENKDRTTALNMAYTWDKVQRDFESSYSGNILSFDREILSDFVCHQSDVIEMLAHALSFANKKLLEKDKQNGNCL